MTKKPENPPAFPQPDSEVGELESQFSGMTLRDYFAAASLTGMLAADPDDEGNTADFLTGRFAKTSYKLADAMLKARMS